MPQLSDTGTRAYKLKFIGSLAAIVVAIAVAVCVLRRPQSTLLTMTFVVAMSLVALAWSVRRIPWGLADEVVDEASCLQVRRRSAQARVALEDIADVHRDATNFARYVRVELVRAIPSFGTEIVFRPRDYASMTTEELNRLIEELRSRVPRAVSTQNATERPDFPGADGGSVSRALTRKRAIYACAVVLAALAAGNYLLELRVFAPFEKQVLVGCVVALAIAMHFFAPTIAEMDGLRDAKILYKRLKRGPR